MATATIVPPPLQPAAGKPSDLEWTLILPDSSRVSLTVDDWNYLVSFWARIEKSGQSLSAAPAEISGIVLALRELMLDVIGIRGEHVEEIFSRRYGADLLDCIKSQLWFHEVVQRLSCIRSSDLETLGTGSLKNISIRRKDRIARWQHRAKVLTLQYFGPFAGKRWTVSSAEPLLQHLREVSELLDFEDLEVLLHTSLPLSGDRAVRVNIEASIQASIGSRFGEWLRPDPWACLWQFCEGTHRSH